MHHPLPGHKVAVIDMGSRSLRLVIFGNFGRSLIPLHTERVNAFLAQNLSQTGCLNPAGVALVLSNLERFIRLVNDLDVKHLYFLATAATRDASDGPAFVQKIESISGTKVHILSGDEEATYAASAIMAAYPGAGGLMGDLGGGSLELALIHDNISHPKVSLPIGPLRIMDEEKPRKIVKDHLASVEWLPQGSNLYLIGGGPRAFANYHMETTDYPLPVSQGYSMEAEEFMELCRKISKATPEELAAWSESTSGRKYTLATNGIILEELTKRLEPKRIYFSSYGLRQGYLYSLLTDQQKAEDPLLKGAAYFNEQSSRCPRFAPAAMTWMDPLFEHEAPALRRLRQAACFLSDMGWMEHHNFVANTCFERAASMPFVGLSHEERAFLGLTLFARYGGKTLHDSQKAIASLLSKENETTALQVGEALRLAYTLAGSATHVLEETGLHLDGKTLILDLGTRSLAFSGDEVARRLEKTAKLFELSGRFSI